MNQFLNKSLVSAAWRKHGCDVVGPQMRSVDWVVLDEKWGCGGGIVELWEFELAEMRLWDLADFVDAYRGELPSVSSSWLKAKGGLVGLEDALLDAGQGVKEVAAVSMDIARWDRA